MKIPNFLICEFDVGMHNDQQTSKLSWGLQGPTEFPDPGTCTWKNSLLWVD